MDDMESLIQNIMNKGKCPDNFIGTIKIDADKKINSELHFCKFKRLSFCNRDMSKNKLSENNIVIVLESPHNDEYDNNKPIAPALGITGCKLEHYFDDIIKKLIENKEISNNVLYNIILMNAIKYQCSNGETLSNVTIRNRTNQIWKDIWKNKNGQICFGKRLKSYKPYIIINACTGWWNGEYTLKHHVSDEIKKVFTNNVKIYRVGHPSSWYNVNNRKLVILE